MANDTTTKIDPPFPAPPHLAHSGIAAWVTYPPGAVVQFVQPTRNTLELASWLVGPAYDFLDRRFPDQRAFTLVLDLSLMTGRSAAARAMFLSKAKQCGSRFARGCLIPPLDTSAPFHLSVRAAAAIIRALGIRVDVVDSTAEALALYELRLDPGFEQPY